MTPNQRNAALFAILMALTGCEERRIEVIKFDARELGMHYAVAWEKPEGYYSVPPGQFREAAYRKDSNGERAEISVSSLRGGGGGIMANVNRWRGQAGLNPLSEDSIAELPIREFGGIRMFFIDARGARNHIQGAILPVGEETWFFKLSGSVAMVAGETAEFMKLLNSITSDSPEISRQPKLSYELPDGWSEGESESAIRAVTLKVPAVAKEEEPMDLIVVPMAASSPVSMTIEMWRDKLGKPDDGAKDEPKAGKLGDQEFILFDESGEEKRLLGAICDLDGVRWHFEVSGDPESIAAQEENFRTFLASVTFEDENGTTN